MNQTVLVFSLLWALSLTLVYAFKSLWYLLVPHMVFVINELLYIEHNKSFLFPTRDLTQIFYDLASIPTKLGAVNSNYSEGHYPTNDYSISPKQAEENKFKKILEFLGAVEGDTILDMGSGTCGFGEYCAARGIKVIGFTLSKEQVELCSKKGMVAYQKDFTQFHLEFVNTADHIIMMGSTEHIETGSHRNDASYTEKYDKIKHMLSTFTRYFKEKSKKPQRIFFSGLHVNPSFKDAWELFVIERAYGGTYMLNTPELNIEHAALGAGFKKVQLIDATRDYYLATALDPTHFGNPSSATSKYMIGLLALSLVYPFAIYMWVYVVLGLWMWMFDGNHHIHGDENYTFKPMESRPATLWWYVGEYRGSLPPVLPNNNSKVIVKKNTHNNQHIQTQTLSQLQLSSITTVSKDAPIGADAMHNLHDYVSYDALMTEGLLSS